MSGLPLNVLDMPPEVISEVFQYLDKGRYPLAQTCSYFSDIIHNIVGYTRIEIKQESDTTKIGKYPGIKANTLVSVANSIKLPSSFKNLVGIRNLNLWDSPIRDEHIAQLAGVHTIDLGGTRVTDVGLKALAGVHTIHLTNCVDITGEGIKELAGVHMLSINSLNKAQALNSLKGLHTIDFSSHKQFCLFSYAIRDEHLKVVSGLGVKEVNLDGVYSFTDEGLKHLSGVHKINLSHTKTTDKGLKYLAGVHVIIIRDVRNITDEGIKHISGVHTLDIAGCKKVTDEGLRSLKGVHNINLSRICNITDRGVKALAGVHTIHLEGTRVTNEGIRAIEGVHTIDVTGCRVSAEVVEGLAGVCKIVGLNKFKRQETKSQSNSPFARYLDNKY